jgi:hypothetical protein
MKLSMSTVRFTPHKIDRLPADFDMAVPDDDGYDHDLDDPEFYRGYEEEEEEMDEDYEDWGD